MPDRKTASTPLAPQQSLSDLLEECRMILPGIQAIFGFQLVAVFETPFPKILSPSEQTAHLAAIFLMALAIGTLIAPASYHRLVEPNSVSRKFLRLAACFMTTGLGFLASALTIDIYLIARIILQNVLLAALTAAAIALFLLTLWFFLPLRQLRRNHPEK